MNYVNHYKAKTEKVIFLNLLIDPFAIIFFVISFYKFFFTCTKMSETLSAKYYQEYKESLQRKTHEWYQNTSKEEKNPNNMVVKITKIYQEMKNKSFWV